MVNVTKVLIVTTTILASAGAATAHDPGAGEAGGKASGSMMQRDGMTGHSGMSGMMGMMKMMERMGPMMKRCEEMMEASKDKKPSGGSPKAKDGKG